MKRKTKFEALAQKILILCTFIFIVGGVYVKSVESSYDRQIQKLNSEINNVYSDIDSLSMQKQELATFNRVADVAITQGYSYQNQATAGVK